MKKSLGARTLLYPTPVLAVGSYDADGRPNVMTAAWGGICCSPPPAIAISLRAATLTHANIMSRRAFTVSITPERYAKEADYFGIASGRDVDKFAATGLTPVPSDLVDAPYVGEFPLIVECKVIQVVEIGLHTEFIGEVVDVKVDEQLALSEDEALIEGVRPLLWAPYESGYWGIGEYFGKAFQIGRSLPSR